MNRFLGWLIVIASPIAAYGQQILRGGENLMHRSAIEYAGNVEGTVVLEARLDAKGVVRDARVISGPDELRAAALKSVLDWHYSIEKGAPPIVEIAIEFKLPKAPMKVIAPPAASGTLKSIDFAAVYGELKDRVLAKLTVKAGDQVPAESHAQIVQAIKSIDEHLQVRITSGSEGTRILVSMASPYWTSQPAGQPNQPKRIRVGGNVQAVNILQKVNPVYPAEAKQQRVQGVVRLKVIIGPTGTVSTVELESGDPLLVDSAVNAVKQWVYRPTLLNGVPVEVQTTVDVNYTLRD